MVLLMLRAQPSAGAEAQEARFVPRLPRAARENCMKCCFFGRKERVPLLFLFPAYGPARLVIETCIELPLALAARAL